MVCELCETRTPFRDAQVSCCGMYVLYVVEGRGWGLGVGGWGGLGAVGGLAHWRRRLSEQWERGRND